MRVCALRRGRLRRSRVPGRGDSPLGKLFERRQIVRITPQRVPGVRFTVQCPDFKPGDRFGSETFAPPIQDCAYPLRFWADNNLFAPALGVDVAQMRAPAGEGVEQWYVQTFPAEAIEGYGPFITRWTIHTPDGRLIEADSTGVDRPARRDLDSWFMKSQFDIKAPRIRALIPATDIDPKASRFAVLVLDLATERQISTVRAGSRDPRVPGPPRQ